MQGMSGKSQKIEVHLTKACYSICSYTHGLEIGLYLPTNQNSTILNLILKS